MVDWSRLYEAALLRTPWWWACRPENTEERDGAQSGVAAWPWVKVTPWLPSQSVIFGVAQSVCLGWSSVTINRMSGRAAGAAAAAEEARAGVTAGAAAAAAPARKPRRPTQVCSLIGDLLYTQGAGDVPTRAPGGTGTRRNPQARA